ncbi:MarR family transcriptional regulator [Pedobacter sp. JY14-1]|uniref:MarR family winged helix-turn-helix transcriptional regulator n=1 Tax=Pedobacter sp. JY14-1 TaxID=3034151 RepID=UPI0023E1847C|nr:MarR family transcriptional regulator [Pedobacter sp. JY14-1]
MNYKLIADLLHLAEEFEQAAPQKGYSEDINGFCNWIGAKENGHTEEPDWEFKAHGRSPESVISTLIVKMNRYAKNYVKPILQDSGFSTQDEFVYLINLKVFGKMTKMELIRKNIQDKPAGMQVINRLIKSGWVEQTTSPDDKRSKVIRITPEGLQALEGQMHKIRQATNIVTGNLDHREKMELIRLLNKLDVFHHRIYHQNIDSGRLLDTVMRDYLNPKN